MRVDEDIFIKHRDIHWEAYIDNGWNTYCIAKGTVADKLIVDKIDTPERFRRRGHATRLTAALKMHFNLDLHPFAIDNTDCAIGFWNSIKLEV